MITENALIIFPLTLEQKLFILKQKILPVKKENGFLKVAIHHESQQEQVNLFEFVLEDPLCFLLMPLEKITFFLYKFYNPLNDLSDHSQLSAKNFIHYLFMQAIFQKASDIHLEPGQQHYTLRLRIDGLLHILFTLPIPQAHLITTRLKVLFQCDIGQKRLPQDGRFHFTTDHGLTKNLRLSTCPTFYGEKCVIRILDTEEEILNIDHLGLQNPEKIKILTAIKKPQGFILVTGPTGSGKTVTLYTLLKILNQPEKNIYTAEDPIEIYMEGVHQTSINPKIQLNFAQLLRAFLRQDPDIIMIGEIRDFETADIAIKAAQTGHLVLSTLHTNSASNTLARLINLGISPLNLTDSLQLIIAQRLLRKLCNHCKSPWTPSQELLQKLEFFSAKNPTFYQPQGCNHCLKGYSGRTGIFEVMPITPTLAELLWTTSSSSVLKQRALQEGMVTLRQAALQKVMKGETSLSEANRLTL